MFVCPACQTSLDTEPGLQSAPIVCAACGTTYPTLGRIPLLVSDAPATWASWRFRLDAFVHETHAIERHLWAELVDPALPEATRRRLRRVAEAMPEHRALLLELFHEVGLEPKPAAGGDAGRSILDYSTLVFRDFAWWPEVDEVTPALSKLRSVLPRDVRLGKTLVFGAGTARLAWDLGHHVDPSAEIVALDMNPLPFLVTQRLLAGRAVSLYELPGHPRRSEDAAVRHDLRAPHPAPASLKLLLADGLRVPVRSEAFDTVVTPWFIDQVPSDLAEFLPELSRVLRPGGAWLHTGPFVYDPARTKPAHRYGQEELLELCARAGFSVTKRDDAPAPYLVSPLSTQGRQEWVLTFHAIKEGGPTQSSEPGWLTEGPIPRLEVPEGTTWPLPILDDVLELVDGRRSAREIALALLARGELADDGNAEAVVRGCLRVLWKAAR